MRGYEKLLEIIVDAAWYELVNNSTGLVCRSVRIPDSAAYAVYRSFLCSELDDQCRVQRSVIGSTVFVYIFVCSALNLISITRTLEL